MGTWICWPDSQTQRDVSPPEAKLPEFFYEYTLVRDQRHDLTVRDRAIPSVVRGPFRPRDKRDDGSVLLLGYGTHRGVEAALPRQQP